MRKIVLAIFMLFTLSLAANADGLTDMLVKSLGVTQKQASGGAGSILNYAKGNMDTNDFGKVAAAIPGIDSLLGAAPKATQSGGGLGAMASALGGNSLGGIASLASQFGALGLSGGMVQKFIPIILDYVKNSGGEGVMQLLQSALK